MHKLFSNLVLGLTFASVPAFASSMQESAQLGRIHIQADKVDLLSTHELKASGNVTVTGKESVIHAQEAVIRRRGPVIEVQAQALVQSEPSSRPSSEFNPLSLQDARAAGGEMRLQKEGYAPVRVQGLSTVWWNDSNQTCITVKTSQGRYSDVKKEEAEVCRRE